MQQFPFFYFRDGGELVYVANHQQLHSAERLVVVAHSSHHGINGVEQVGAHHRYLVDDEQVDGTHYLQLVGAYLLILCRPRPDVAVVGAGFIECVFRNLRTEGQLEKRVYGGASRIDGGDSRWCYNDMPLVCRLRKPS